MDIFTGAISCCIITGMKTRLPASSCPRCLRDLDGATSVAHEGRPDPGDVTMCIYCSGLAIFGDDLRLRNPTKEERAEIEAQPLIHRMRNLMKKKVLQ